MGVRAVKHLTQRQAAEQLFKALKTGHGQQSLLPVTQLPQEMMRWLHIVANREGYMVWIDHSGKSEVIRLVAQQKRKEGEQ